jgi:hypothetical protein
LVRLEPAAERRTAREKKASRDRAIKASSGREEVVEWRSEKAL